MWRLAEGDRTAFGPVFALLWPQVRAFAERLVGPADGEDAAQAALLKIFSRASEYDRARDALPWALGIAAWECRTLRRRRGRLRERSVPAPERAAEGALSPEEAVLERELRAAAEEVVGTMRPIDVETIISIATGHRTVRGATFRKRVERALARFKLACREPLHPE